jgi:hypothetical protein
MTQDESQGLLLELFFIFIALPLFSVDILNIKCSDDIVNGCGGLQDDRWDGGKGWCRRRGTG